MLLVLKKTWSLYISMTLILFGLGFQNTILPIKGKIAGFEGDILGYVMGMYYVGFFLGVYVVPKFIQKVGYIRVFATLGTLSSTFIVLFGLVSEAAGWMGIRLIMGLCYSGLFLVTESWINNSVDNKNRGNALSIYLILSYIGMTFGQYIIVFFDVNNLSPFVWVSLILSISFIPVLLTKISEPAIDNTKAMSFLETYKASPMGFIGLGFTGLGNTAIFVIGGIYVSYSGGSAEQVSYFMMSATVGTIIGLYPGGKLSDIYDRRYIIVGLCLISLFGTTLVLLSEEIGLLLYVGVLLINIGLGPLYSVCVAQTNDWIEVDQRVSAAARLGFIYGAGNVFGSILFSFLLGRIGSDVFIYAQFALYGALLIFTISRILSREQQVQAQQASFVAYPARANVAIEILDDCDKPKARKVVKRVKTRKTRKSLRKPKATKQPIKGSTKK